MVVSNGSLAAPNSRSPKTHIFNCFGTLIPKRLASNRAPSAIMSLLQKTASTFGSRAINWANPTAPPIALGALRQPNLGRRLVSCLQRSFDEAGMGIRGPAVQIHVGTDESGPARSALREMSEHELADRTV
jgi:hypothetical protein